jgi:two-component system, cell cycle response regulator
VTAIAPPLAGAKILVADDDAALVGTLAFILREQGAQVVTLPNGEHLLEQIEKEMPDLLLLDIMMPTIDGLELLGRIRSQPRWADLPVLMVSSMPPEDATVKSFGLGAADFVPKPFRVRELMVRIEAHLARGRELRAARDEVKSREKMVDILHEVTDSLKPDEIYHILARRVARALNKSRCSLVLAKPGDVFGTVVAAYENPMLRNLRIQLARYPEILRALEADQIVIVEDVSTDPLFAEVRGEWLRDGVAVQIGSVVALPFRMRGEQSGVLFLRTARDETPLTKADAHFADTVIKAAVAAIEKAHDFASIVSDRERLEHLASHDALTGCLNRRALIEMLEREWDRSVRYSLVLTVLMIDLDHFKQVNDTQGHLAGDSVLRLLGDLLRREVRSVDTVGRYGGEEFVVILPETALHGAVIFAERVRQRIQVMDFGNPERPLPVTVSIGVASVPDARATTPETFLALADEALYRAKGDGRNVVRT